MKDTHLTLKRVKHVPNQMEQGVLYYSEEFQLANHLCACGQCKVETVTPIDDGSKGWTFTEGPNGPTLHPSIGNFQMPCKSHYWIQDGKIVWC